MSRMVFGFFSNRNVDRMRSFDIDCLKDVLLEKGWKIP